MTASQLTSLGTEWNDYLKLMAERPELFVPSRSLEIITDGRVVADFQERSGRRIGLIYRSRFNTLVVDLVRDERGNVFPFERIFATSTGMGVVGVPLHEGKYILLRQFRHSMRAYQYAFPRGYGEDGLSAAQDVAKELEEELGASLREVELLGHVVANSGISGDRVAVFRCQVESFEAQIGHEGIDDFVVLSEEELSRWIAEGKIDDGFTLAAWAMIQAKREE